MEEVVVGEPQAARAPPSPRFMYRVMNIPILRKAPWLMYVFMLWVAIGLAVMCVRLQLGDHLMAIICASVTAGLILATALCVFLSVRRDGLSESSIPKAKKQKITVMLKAHNYECEKVEDPVTCHICLTDLERDEKVVALECGHLFHVDCATSWVKRVAQCPACRHNLPVQIRSSTSTPSQEV